jgi:myosin heavy subunit
MNEIELPLFLKTEPDGSFKKMYPDDLASLEVVDEEKVLLTLGNRYSRGQFQTYAGTALLIVTPQSDQSLVYEKEVKHFLWLLKNAFCSKLTGSFIIIVSRALHV